MRRPILAAGLALALCPAGAALAQTPSLPETSRSEAQVNSLNRSMMQDQQSRAANQQNQFEVNSLRNELTRPVPPPVTGGAIIVPGTGR